MHHMMRDHDAALRIDHVALLVEADLVSTVGVAGVASVFGHSAGCLDCRNTGLATEIQVLVRRCLDEEG